MRIASNLKKILFFLAALFVILFSLSSPYSTHNIDKLAYVIAMGLDVGQSNKLKLTIQLSKPESGSGGSSGSSYTNIVDTVECSSIDSGISLFNSYISRRINLSHCKVIVISADLASQGVSDYIFTLLNNVEMSPHASIIVSKTTAEEFINNSKPELEDLASRYYEVSLSSNKYTGYTSNVSLVKFFSDSVDSFTNPVATLGSIGDMPIKSNDNAENMGLAIFKNDKLVGELTAQETIWHMIVSNHLKSCTLSIPDPLGDTESIDVNLKLDGSPKKTVNFINGTPHISCKIKVKIQILSATQESTSSNYNYYENENIKMIEKTCSDYLQKTISDYLYKTSKEYNSDIDSFGKYAVKYFATIKDWEEYNWLDNYYNSIFNVEVSTTLKSGYSFL